MLLKTTSMCTLLASTLMFSSTAVQQATRPQRSSMQELKSAHLFTITIKLQPPIEMGDTPAGKRRIFAVTGGEFVGARIRGTIMPVIGSDLLLVRADGSAQQDVRMLLKTDGGELVLMTYRGVRHASPEVNARIARGEQVSGSDYYLRTSPFFETPSTRYSWINRIVAVGVGERRADSVIYEVFEIL
jgi:hypothetical protein